MKDLSSSRQICKFYTKQNKKKKKKILTSKKSAELLLWSCKSTRKKHAKSSRSATSSYLHTQISLSLSLSLSPTLGWANLRSFQTKISKEITCNPKIHREWRNGSLLSKHLRSSKLKKIKNKK
jgi:hypothetical protein